MITLRIIYISRKLTNCCLGQAGLLSPHMLCKTLSPSLSGCCVQLLSLPLFQPVAGGAGQQAGDGPQTRGDTDSPSPPVHHRPRPIFSLSLETVSLYLSLSLLAALLRHCQILFCIAKFNSELFSVHSAKIKLRSRSILNWNLMFF